MSNIKVRSTYYPENRPSKEEWFKEFRIGIMDRDKPNAFGMTFNDYICELKKMGDEENRDFAGQDNFVTIKIK